MPQEEAKQRINYLVRSGRSDEADWVTDTHSVGDIATILAAMANGGGGTLLVGVETAGEEIAVRGVRNDMQAIDRVLQAALSLQPALILPMPRVVNVDGSKVIETQVPAGMPHVYSLDGRYLIRSGTANEPLNPLQLRRLFIQRGAISFESEIAPGAHLDDLDWDKVHSYVNGLDGLSEMDAREVLLRRGCLMQQERTLRPTNAGILLFGKHPQRFVRGADITAVRFAGETMGDTFSRHDITGTLPDQIRRAETFLVDHLRKGVALGETMARTERYEYPMEAARELVVNAVAHRDYSISGDGIRLFIFKDRMEVISAGGLAGPVTLANIKDERFSRNPVIVQVLSDMGFIERLGYGVDRVLELMRNQHLREPDFTETGGSFRVVLYNQRVASDESSEESPTPRSPELTRLLTMHRDLALNPRQEAALTYLLQPENSRITNSELQAQFKDVHAETIRRDLADLVAKNILVKKGQKRGSYYVLQQGNPADHETE